MNIYQVEEMVPKGINEYECVKLYVLANTVQEVSEMFRDRRVRSILEACPVSEFPEQKYCVRPVSDVDWGEVRRVEEVVDEAVVDEGVGLLRDTEALLRDLKHYLVHAQDYKNGAMARQAQWNLRVLLGEPVNLEQLFRRLHCRGDGSSEDVEDKPSLFGLKLFSWVMNTDGSFSLDDAVSALFEAGAPLDRDQIRRYLEGMVEEGLLSEDHEQSTSLGNPRWRLPCTH